jgi:hypothetical protein
VSLLDIFFDQRPKLGHVQVDLTTSETHSLTGELSDSPVEFGLDLSDHYRVMPELVQVEFLVSATPDELAAQWNASELGSVRTVATISSRRTPSLDERCRRPGNSMRGIPQASRS